MAEDWRAMDRKSGLQHGNSRACACPVLKHKFNSRARSQKVLGKSGSASGGQDGALSRLSRSTECSQPVLYWISQEASLGGSKRFIWCIITGEDNYLIRSRVVRRSWAKHDVPAVKTLATPSTSMAIALRAARQFFDGKGHMCGIIVLGTIPNMTLSRKRGCSWSRTSGQAVLSGNWKHHGGQEGCRGFTEDCPRSKESSDKCPAVLITEATSQSKPLC